MNLNKNLLIGALLTGLFAAPAIAADKNPRHGDGKHGRYDTQQQKHRDGRHEQRWDRAQHDNRQRHDADRQGRDHGKHHADANRNRNQTPHHRQPDRSKHHAYRKHQRQHDYRKHQRQHDYRKHQRQHDYRNYARHNGKYQKPNRKHYARHHDQRYDGRIGNHYYRSQPWRIQVFDSRHRLRSSIPVARGSHWEVRGNRIIVKNRGHVQVYAGPRYHLVKSYRVHDRHNRDSGLRFGFRF